MELDELVREIENRSKARIIECRDSDRNDKILRAQGAARELEQLLAFVEQADRSPQKEEVS